MKHQHAEEEIRTAKRVHNESLPEEPGFRKTVANMAGARAGSPGWRLIIAGHIMWGISQGLRVWKKILRSVGREHYQRMYFSLIFADAGDGAE